MSYANDKNNDWVNYLRIVEICINNSKQLRQNIAIFINYGYDPCFDGLFERTKKRNALSVEEYVKKIYATIEIVRKNLKKAQDNEESDHRRRRVHSFTVNDLVYVTASHIIPQSGISKLNPLLHEPFRMAEKLKEGTFRLDLPLENQQCISCFFIETRL